MLSRLVGSVSVVTSRRVVETAFPVVTLDLIGTVISLTLRHARLILSQYLWISCEATAPMTTVCRDAIYDAFNAEIKGRVTHMHISHTHTHTHTDTHTFQPQFYHHKKVWWIRSGLRVLGAQKGKQFPRQREPGAQDRKLRCLCWQNVPWVGCDFTWGLVFETDWSTRCHTCTTLCSVLCSLTLVTCW